MVTVLVKSVHSNMSLGGFDTLEDLLKVNRTNPSSLERSHLEWNCNGTRCAMINDLFHLEIASFTADLRP